MSLHPTPVARHAIRHVGGGSALNARSVRGPPVLPGYARSLMGWVPTAARRNGGSPRVDRKCTVQLARRSRRSRRRPWPPDACALPRSCFEGRAGEFQVKPSPPPRDQAERHRRLPHPQLGGVLTMVMKSSGEVLKSDLQSLTDAIRDLGTAKEVARVIGCSEHTAFSYQNGLTMPNPRGLVRLMRHSRSIAHVLLKMAGLDDISLDLEEARLIRELREFQAKREESRHEHAVSGAGNGLSTGVPPIGVVGARG